VTSKTGAVFSDICTVIGRRAKVRILLAPAVVQGDAAVESILQALTLLEGARPDVVILGRGGGSSLDLMAFNDERVVRKVAQYSIPIISAVGHEVDFSLTDLVADARAATPSEAAEMVVPDVAERVLACARMRSHLVRAFRAHLAETRLRVDRYHRRLRDPRFFLAQGQQTLDELRSRLLRRIQVRFARSRDELERSRRTLYARHPRGVLAHARADLGPLRERLGAAVTRRLDKSRAELGSQAAALGALSPLAILGRGYALALDGEGRAVRDVGTLSPGDEVTIRVRRGTFSAEVQNVISTVENHATFSQESPAGYAAEEETS
jgi:exodeoxyribonuclease VII large subunit